LHPQRGPLRGADLCYQLEISPEEAEFGATKTFELDTMAVCGSCRGDGAKPASTLQVCSWCEGRGQYREASRIFAASGVCPRCEGTGSVRLLSCNGCNGSGRRLVRKTVEVAIPPGVEDNSRLKIAHQGDVGDYSAGSGDLYVSLHVRPQA
jgi:molecular chaperone DnaJ